jgi:hypothetical protein
MSAKTMTVRLLLILGSRIGTLDKWGHQICLPGMLQGPLCDAWDWHLGMYDDTEVPHYDSPRGEDM